LTTITKEERANGWDEQSLAAYRRDRDKVADVVAGNVVTEFERPKPAVRIEGAGMAYNPISRSYSR